MKISRKEYLREHGLIRYPKYRRTKDGLISIMFSSVRGNSKKRNMELPTFTKDEFKQWVLSQCNFDMLFNAWADDNYSKRLRSSIDRLDDYTGYLFPNIRLTTWDDNKRKGYEDRKHGINNKRSIQVTQIDKATGQPIAKYHSLMEAQRNTGILAGNIWNVVCGKGKTAGGFKWAR